MIPLHAGNDITPGSLGDFICGQPHTHHSSQDRPRATNRSMKAAASNTSVWHEHLHCNAVVKLHTTMTLVHQCISHRNAVAGNQENIADTQLVTRKHPPVITQVIHRSYQLCILDATDHDVTMDITTTTLGCTA